MCKLKPMISVVTVVFNNVENIERTIQSVIMQSFDEYEYIIVDGGSIDGTVDLVKRYSEHVTKFVSEKDKGLYDAMNKGLSLCNGNFVVFMNSGDTFYDTDTLSRVAKEIGGDIDAIYGNHIVEHVDNKNKRNYIVSLPPSDSCLLRMPFCHQTLYIRRELALKYKFDDRLRIGADFKQIVQLFNKDTFIKLDKPLAIVSNGGISDKERLNSVLERIAILRSLGLYTPKVSILYYIEMANQVIRLFLKNLLKYFRFI